MDNNYCDRCGAQAKARFVLATGDLFFCGHHARQYKDGLISAGAAFDGEYATDHELELATV